MKVRSSRLLLASLAGTALAALVASHAMAAPKKGAAPISDGYGGDATSVGVDPETQEPVIGSIQLTIGSVKNRRFGGTVSLGSLQDVPIQGTLSASGQVSIQAKVRGGAKLTLKGKFTDATLEPPTLKKIQGTYQFNRGGDRGTFVVADLTP